MLTGSRGQLGWLVSSRACWKLSLARLVCGLVVVTALSGSTDQALTPINLPMRPAAALSRLPGKQSHLPSVGAKSHFKGHLVKTDYAPEDLAKGWEQLYAEGQVQYRSGKYDEAYKTWAASVKVVDAEKPWTKASGDEQIELLKKLALMFKTQQRPQDAARMYEMAINTAVSIHGKESLPVANLMLELGRIYTFSDKIKSFARADELLHEAFRINEKIYGRDTIPAGDVAIALAQLLQDHKQYKAAASYWKLAVDIGNKLEPGIISCCRIGPRQGLAKCYEGMGKFDEAIAVHKELLAMCRQGATNMVPTVLSNYAQCLRAAGHADEALKLEAS